MKKIKQNNIEGVILNEIQLILAEKRTSLSFLRTGIAVFALPLSVLSALIATSKYYEFIKVLHFLIPVLILCLILIFLGFYLVIRSIKRIRHYDRIIQDIKKKYDFLESWIE